MTEGLSQPPSETPPPAARPRPAYARYGVAVLVVMIAWGVTHLLDPYVDHTFAPLFYVAILVAAWYGGLGPGLVGSALATFITAYFYFEPAGSLELGFDDVVRLATFTGTVVLISSLAAHRRNAEAALRRAHNQLEWRVRSRTAELQHSNEQLERQIVERKRAEAALRQSEERFRLLVEGVEDYAVFMLDDEGYVVSWNTGAQRIMGWDENEIVAEHCRVFFPAEDAQRGKPEADLNDAVTLGRAEDEGWRIRKDGTKFWANVILTALRDDAGNLRGYATVMRDVSERKELETAILTISEREQRRIGHDLHDGLGQELTGIAFLGKALSQTLEARRAPEADDARHVAALVNGAIARTRQLARNLYPTELEADGLETALRQLALRVESVFHIACTFHCERSVGTDDRSVATHVFRIAQEAINNAIKHAKARCIDLTLGAAGEEGVLTVRDDGIGFDPPTSGGRAESVAGMGLHLMNYRARSIGGSLDIRRDPRGGTMVTCSWRRTTGKSPAADIGAGGTAYIPVEKNAHASGKDSGLNAGGNSARPFTEDSHHDHATAAQAH